MYTCCLLWVPDLGLTFWIGYHFIRQYVCVNAHLHVCLGHPAFDPLWTDQRPVAGPPVCRQLGDCDVRVSDSVGGHLGCVRPRSLLLC